MNSEWQLNRIGLLDFWYYDEQEFEFLDGRMLLRGANGSGKSVTMQSFIPLLLDGNMRPERLDPFGSRARKMENYLLEEGDEREERTGYLYMELKRTDSDTYTTIGIGIRARRNKKLDTWYFSITDGRRIGKDFFLYKDVQNRIAYTKQELKNRIGEAGGQVMDTQGDYARCVNRLLFGFETMEEYQEMIELLIQLRTPKLSKDFKPTVINEILSRSLQTLSEDDLRPMSEAIENMDSLKTNLDNLNESVRAAEQIEKAYNQYNEMMLYEKAALFSKSAQECRQLEKKSEELKQQEKASAAALEQEEGHYEELRREEEVLRQEERSLKDSDAARLKQEELALEGELAEHRKELAQKNKQAQDKKEAYLEVENRLKRQREQNEQMLDSVQEYLEEMEETLEDVPFDDFSFLKNELMEAPENEYQFGGHGQLLSEYTKRVETGKEALLEEKRCQEHYDHYLQQLDERRNELEQKERECRQYEMQLSEIRSETVEKFYQWEKQNEQLHLSDEVKQRIAQKLEQYVWGTDYAEIRELARDVFYEVDRSLRQKQTEWEHKKAEVKKQQEQLLQELHEWKNKKEPEPECSEAVRQNRQLLQEKGIPYLQFYKAVDFGQTLDEEQASRVEEALLEMGILDALIVSEEYREQIRTLDPGVCDRYLFSDVAHVKQSLLELLDVDNEENDILRYQGVANILSSIGIQQGEKSSTWIDTEGNYRIGVLEGTVTRTYKAHYIGVRAREAYKKEKISQLELEASRQEAEYLACETELSNILQKIRKLSEEWNAFPADTDLKTAAKDYEDRRYACERLEELADRLREQVRIQEEALKEIQRKVRELCSKCYLTARLDLFTEALQSLQEYKRLLMELQIAHSNYRNGIQNLQSLQERLDALEEDLDNLRYECGKAARKMKELEGSLNSIREQLKLTDYEQIRARLDHCIERLRMLPQERETSVRQQTHWKEEKERLARELRQQEADYQHTRIRFQYLEQAFRQEYQLGYVERLFVVNDDMEEQAEKVCSMLSGKIKNQKKDQLLGNLQGAYHQNRGYLLDHQLTMQTLFEKEDSEPDGISMHRIDLTAKYRGINVTFKELLMRLREDAEEKKRLLSDKDRELFEDILANTISKKIRGKIQSSKRWISKMNQLMDSMHTSSGLKLSLNWKSKRAEKEEQLDTRELVELLQKDVEIMREEEVEKLSLHFRSKIGEARKLSDEGNSIQSFHAIMREVLDYRKWFEFTLECQKTGEKKKELTDRVFFTFSGGEKAMSMYVPLFSAVVAKYAGARPDAPRLISLDEAFAGVDETNIRDMFRLMVECRFNFMINSQVLWGDYDTVPGLAIFQLLRPENAKYVTVISYLWNGKERILADREAVYG